MPKAAADIGRIFGDQVFSVTDLNRRHREVLDQARTQPITISRNNEQFALMKRDQVADLVRAVAELDSASEVLWGAVTVRLGEPVPRNLDWLKAFDPDDLTRMTKEILDLIRDSMDGRSGWDLLEDLIHQWRESAIVAQTGALASSMAEPGDEVPLTIPEASE